MKVLVLGSGAREHAIAWKFSKSNILSGLYVAPGNAGTEDIAENLPDVDPCGGGGGGGGGGEYKIDFVFVGPEAPLAAGVVDDLEAAGIYAFGPCKQAAQLEASKLYSKSFMKKYGIPTAYSEEFDNVEAFEKAIKKSEGKVVIKKNGLAAGKGVLESDDKKELLEFGRNILKDDTLLVEEFLTGWETSIFAISDGKDFVLLPPCADFKKAYDKDQGPNTGGMGSICPVPTVSKDLLAQIEKEVVIPTFEGIKKEGYKYIGLLYFGLMITPKGPKLLEYNARFGDPETQALLPLIDSDFGSLFDAVRKQELASFPLEISNKCSLCVVIAAGGYPGKYAKGNVVHYMPLFRDDLVVIFHASTGRDMDNNIITGGGRCFSVVGLGKDFAEASKYAYIAADEVYFKDCFHRSDIGKKFFEEL